MKKNLSVLAESGIIIALAFVFNLIAIRLPINFAGGSISFSMLPIMFFAILRGPIWGGIAGTAFGFLDMILEPFFLHPVQILLDYPIPYLLLGVGVGLFSPLYKKVAQDSLLVKGSIILIIATIVGVAFRLVAHLISGIVFFGSNAPEGQNVFIYSLVYNLSYLLPSLIINGIFLLIITPLVYPVISKNRI